MENEKNIKDNFINFDLSQHEFYRKDPDKLNRFGRFLWRTIWYMPFDKYEKYYVNGKIFEMSQREKIEMTVQDSIENQKQSMFTRIVKMRPTILNYEDMELFEKESNKVRKLVYICLGTLFINGSFFTFKMAMKRDIKYIYKFLGGNLVILGFYMFVKLKEAKLYTYLYNKYENFIDYNDMRKSVLQAENKQDFSR